MVILFEQKADKHTVDKLVSRSKFDQSIGGLDQSLQELLQRVEGQVGAVYIAVLVFTYHDRLRN